MPLAELMPLADLLPLAAPALPLDEAGKYVAGAYIVFVLLLVIYVGIMATKLQRIEKELREVASVAERKASEAKAEADREVRA
ncbi:MAG: hypothetical protein AB7V58_10075 [Solirubrobacterales bacterium]